MPFGPRVTSTVAPVDVYGVQMLEAGDFNGDGNLDLISARLVFPIENRSLPVQLLLGDGHGGFRDGTAEMFPNGVPRTVQAREISIADLNGDGRADAWIADHGYDTNPFPGAPDTVVLTQANGTVRTPTSGEYATISDFTHSVAFGDVDGDGDTDVLLGNQMTQGSPNGPVLLLNNGAGGMTAATGKLPPAIASGVDTVTTILFADLNGDGATDLITGQAGFSGTTNPNRIYFNDGHGGFNGTRIIDLPASPLANVASPGGAQRPSAYDIQAADLNGDGRMDLVVLWTRGDFVGAYAQILIQDAAGNFNDETAARLSQPNPEGQGTPLFADLSDFNNDGKPDLLIRRQVGNQLSTLYLNDGTGKFGAGQSVGSEGSVVVAVDLDRDGDLDLAEYAYSQPDGQKFGAYLQTGTPTTATRWGTDAADTLLGSDAADTIFARIGDDWITGGKGNDTIDGGLGFDRAMFSGTRAGYTVASQGGTITVADGTASRDGTDTLTSIEALHFSDKTMFALTGDAATVARLYSAAFARAPDEAGLRFQIVAGLGGGLTPLQLASNFLGSAEFQQLYGAGVTNTQYATQLYRNVLGRDPDAGGLAVQVNALNGGLGRDSLLLNFAESAENKTKVLADWLLLG